MLGVIFRENAMLLLIAVLLRATLLMARPILLSVLLRTC